MEGQLYLFMVIKQTEYIYLFLNKKIKIRENIAKTSQSG
jgi:hypothetical protein